MTTITDNARAETTTTPTEGMLATARTRPTR